MDDFYLYDAWSNAMTAQQNEAMAVEQNCIHDQTATISIEIEMDTEMDIEITYAPETHSLHSYSQSQLSLSQLLGYQSEPSDTEAQQFKRRRRDRTPSFDADSCELSQPPIWDAGMERQNVDGVVDTGSQSRYGLSHVVLGEPE